jgi:integrase/recombinase XerD
VNQNFKTMQTTKRLNKTDATTLVAQACAKVNGFAELYKRLERKISISGRSLSTLKNYSCHLAHIALHFNCLPTELDEEQIEDYLHLLQKQHNTPSDSYFKHTVYGLRFIFRLEGLKDNGVKLPSIKHEKKLPVILSREEVKKLLKTPTLLKHRILLGMLYGCGLRLSEVRNIRLKDIDFNRDRLHIRQSKGKKDRYVPLGKNLIRGLHKYIEAEQPQQWLFNGQPAETTNSDGASGYSQRGIQWVVRKAVRTSGITKEVNAHTLRHTYATHLLEDGLDIVTIKELLGHECIETTMIYLHVAQPGRRPPFSPLDTLYTSQP